MLTDVRNIKPIQLHINDVLVEYVEIALVAPVQMVEASPTL